MRIPRLLVIVLVALVFVAGGAVLVLRLLLPPERIKAAVITRAEAATGYDLEVGRAGLGLAWPGLVVKLDDLVLRNPERTTEDPLLRLEHLDLGVEILPLLRREVQVNRLALVRPAVFLLKDARGVLNAAVGPKPGAGTPRPAGARTGGLLLAVPAARVTGGSFRFVDEIGRVEIAVDDLDGDLRVRVEPDTLRVRADLALGGFRADMKAGGGAAYGPLPVAVKADLTHAPASGTTFVRGATLALAAIDLRVDGRIDAPPAADGGSVPAVDLTLAAADFEPAQVLSLLGKSAPEGLRIGGQAGLRATVRGPARAPDIAGALTLAGVDVTPPGRPGPLLEGLAGEIGFTRTTLEVRGLRGALAGTPFTLSATVADFARPAIAGALEFKARLTDLAALAPPPPGTVLEGGTLAAALDFSTRAPDFARALTLAGSATGEGITARLPGLPVPVRDLAFTARLSGRQGTIEPFHVALGRSDLGGRLTLTSFDPPLLDFALAADRVDLDELLAPPGGGARPAAKPAAKKGPAPLLPMSGTLRAHELIYRKLTARDASLKITLDRDGLRVDDVRAQLLGGHLGGNVAVNLADPDSVRYTSTLKVSGVEANDLLSATTPLRNLIYGRLDANLDLGGIKAGDTPPIALLTALGDATITQGYFAAQGPLGLIAGRMGLLADGRDQIDFQRLAAVFRVEQGRVQLRDTKVGSAKSGEFDLRGSVGFDGTLDYAVSALLPPRYLPAEVARQPEVLALLTDESGRLPVDFAIGGTLREPKVKIDTRKIEERLVAAAKKQVKTKVEAEAVKQFDNAVKEAARGLEGFFGKKKTAPADSGAPGRPR